MTAGTGGLSMAMGPGSAQCGPAPETLSLISRPSLLIVGAASRNVGKTEFVCEVIRRHAGSRDVVGVKVTTVHEPAGGCPRGGQGCGVCTSFEGGYSIVEAAPGPDEKDTTRMLRAGARRVLWLRALRDHLEAGLRDLLGRLGPGTLVVCESNSARSFVRPGVFLVIRGRGSAEVKPSCQEVVAHADRVLVFDGGGWDLPPERLAVAGDRWVVSPEATAVVLAGGLSRRMGSDKALLDAGGRPLVARVLDQLSYFPERLVGSNDPTKLAFLGVPVVPDQEPGRGPLMGILSCLDRARHELCFVTACDVPALDAGFVLGLLDAAEGHDVAVPRLPDGKVEPLLAAYRKTVVAPAREVVARGGRRIVDLYGRVRVRFVPVESLEWYRNLNTADEYRRWLEEGRRAP